MEPRNRAIRSDNVQDILGTKRAILNAKHDNELDDFISDTYALQHQE
jgi:hypothetical protein